jgi:hypothetical protein
VERNRVVAETTAKITIVVLGTLMHDTQSDCHDRNEKNGKLSGMVLS